MRSQLLEKMGNEAVNHFKVDVFNAESFDGAHWKPRQKDDGRRLLVKTGRLRSSIRVMKRTRNSITVGTDVPYAEFHNKGTDRLPKRQFIGESKVLKRKFDGYISDYLKRVGRRSRI
jgi:phage gpG-like protein